ncbi:MAG: DUF255 domain-containing protein, partial [Pseudomonadota bacterium]|nr:DUF255 domain-containing protein [Pseudomonadota bacterium]
SHSRPPIAAGIALLAASCLFQAELLAANALAGNPSPYLAMHGQDPVDWREWGPEALAEARKQNKPLFVSSGYFACHWCHVMQRESYQNPDIAALLNRWFVPVKLDRELHPALDADLIEFVERTAGHAGWPLNVFLTPEGYPLLGLTYAPPDDFKALLKRVEKAWTEQPEKLNELARRAAEERAVQQRASRPSPAPSLSSADLARLLKRHALSFGDDLAGGFGRQTRFPMAPNLSALLELQARAPDQDLGAFLRLTLDAMMRQGLRDHLGGGFYRYTVDPDWQTPHFEKMLYTQALLVPLYLRAATVLERPEYREVARETLSFLVGEMQGREGGYIASLSAVDAQGVEGGYYLWRPEELERLLDPLERKLLALTWGLDGPARHEAGLLPLAKLSPQQAAEKLDLTPEEGVRLLRQARAKLLAARVQRNLPRDGKQLAGWNGLVLSALSAGARAFDDDGYHSAARRLRDFLVQRLWDGERLHRAVSDRGWIGEASLEDYAFVAQGLRDWSELSGSAEDLDLSRRLVRLAWERFHDGDGWRLSEAALLPQTPAQTAFSDSPLPSPAAVLLALTLKGADADLAERARRALKSSRSVAAANPFSFSGQALLLIDHPPGP